MCSRVEIIIVCVLIKCLIYCFLTLCQLTSDIEDPKACALLFVGVLINFVTLIAATWVMFASYVTGAIKPVWPGVALFLQNLLIFVAAFLFRFGRYHESFNF